YPATASMVDLVLPPPKAAAPAARFAPPAATADPRVVPSSDRPLPQSPVGKSALSDTPRPAKGERPRPPSFPHLQLPKPPAALGHLTPSKAPDPPPRPKPVDTPKPLPRADTPRPRSGEASRPSSSELEITKLTPSQPPPPAEPVRTFPS